MAGKQFDKELINMLKKEMQTISGIPKDFKSLYSGYSNVTQNIQSPPEPIGYIIHEPTKTSIGIYKKMNLIHQWFFKLCFGVNFKWL